MGKDKKNAEKKTLEKNIKNIQKKIKTLEKNIKHI